MVHHGHKLEEHFMQHLSKLIAWFKSGSSLASALFAVRRCWHIFSSCVPCCSPSGKHFSLLYFYPSYQRPHQVLRCSHQHPCQNCSPWALEKQAHQGPICQFLSHHIFRKCFPRYCAPALSTFRVCQKPLGVFCPTLPLVPLFFLVHFLSFSPLPFPHLSSSLLSFLFLLPTVSFSFGFINKRNIKVCRGGLVSPPQRKLSGHDGQGCCPYISCVAVRRDSWLSSTSPVLPSPSHRRGRLHPAVTPKPCTTSATTASSLLPPSPPAPLTSHPSVPQQSRAAAGHLSPHLAARPPGAQGWEEPAATPVMGMGNPRQICC